MGLAGFSGLTAVGFATKLLLAAEAYKVNEPIFGTSKSSAPRTQTRSSKTLDPKRFRV